MAGPKAGIDIGSRTIKLVVRDGDEVLHQEVTPTTYDPMAACRALLDGVEYESIVATGYGRHLFAEHHVCEVVTEIRAVGLGALHWLPECRSILDIGGQDTKAITIDPRGRPRKFEMNDRCAAGTGRFLEVMATALGYTMEEFSAAAGRARRGEKVSSMCTVFAETEVISLVSRGADRGEVALGLHQAIANRSSAMLKRVEAQGPVVFAGGVAYNPCIRDLVHTRVGMDLLSPPNPQILAALGCTLV